MYIKSAMISLCFVCLTYADVWIETSQGDFSDGVYERNIYASHLGGGAVEFAPRFDLNNDGYIDLFTADRHGPYVRIYWGGASGYSASNVTLFPCSGAGNCDAADIDGDGYADFVFAHKYVPKLTIYWGSATGPSPAVVSEMMLSEIDGEACFLADFNKDGYLDIGLDITIPGYGSILWGSASGYNFSNRVDLPVEMGQHNIEVADFNKDNWLDILFVAATWPTETYRIYWGSNAGFSPVDFTSFPAIWGSHGVTVADLDGDDFLDIVYTYWYDFAAHIYWGDASGYSTSNMLVLGPGYCYGGSAAADMDKDGFLDIVFHRGGYGIHQQEIYWGSAAGYQNSNVSYVGIPIEASGGLVADFDFDGNLDIFCNTITPGSFSHVFWGSGFTSCTYLPVSYDHHGMFREIGNVYNRQYYEDYTSSIFDAGTIQDWGTVEWDAVTPTGTSIEFWVRSGETPVPDISWSDWTSMLNGASVPEDLNARYLQYRAHLCYLNPCYLPVLQEVRITHGGSLAITAELRINPRTINLDSQGKFTAFIWLPGGYSNYDIDVSTIECHGADASSGYATPQFFIAKFGVQDLVGVVPGAAVEFVLTGQLFDGTEFAGTDTVRVIGTSIADLDCQPNPFKSSTVMSFPSPAGAARTVRIYDISGKIVRSFDITNYHEGRAFVTWDRKDDHGRKVPAGVYFVHGRADRAVFSEKMIVMD